MDAVDHVPFVGKAGVAIAVADGGLGEKGGDLAAGAIIPTRSSAGGTAFVARKADAFGRPVKSSRTRGAIGCIITHTFIRTRGAAITRVPIEARRTDQTGIAIPTHITVGYAGSTFGWRFHVICFGTCITNNRICVVVARDAIIDRTQHTALVVGD